MNKFVIGSVCLVITIGGSIAVRAVQPSPNPVRLTGKEISAIIVAETDLRRKYVSAAGYPRHYTVVLERHGRELKVVFVPNQVALGLNEAGTGGGNKHGPEVAYYVSLDSLKILRFHFAR